MVGCLEAGLLEGNPVLPSGGNNRGKRLSATTRAVIVLGGVLIAAVVAMTGYEIWRQRAITRQAAEQRLASLSLALAEQTERAFQSVGLVLHGTAVQVAAGGVSQDSRVEVREKLDDRMLGIPFILGLAIIDAEGRAVVMAGAFPPSIDDVAEREYFLHHRDNRGSDIHVGKPERSPAGNHWQIPVSQRLDDPDGRFRGIVMVAVDATYFHEVFGKVLLPEGGAFAIYRGDGLLLARHPVIDQVIGQPFAHTPLFSDLLPAARKGIYSGVSGIDFMPRLASYNALEHLPLVLTVSIDRHLLLAPWRGNAVRLSLAALLATIVLTAAVTVLVRQLRREEAQRRALQASEQRLRFTQFALDHAADMVLWIGRDSRIFYANHAACGRLGWTADEMSGLSVTDIDVNVTPKSWPRQFENIRKKNRIRFESAHRTRTGQAFPTEVAANYLAFEGEEYTCAFIRDVGERKQAEAALAEKTARLEASNAELEQFAYVASHDLREPLRMVNGFVTMLARRHGDKLDDEAREFIGYAQEGATRMDRLILDLLEYARVGRQESPLVPISLGPVIEMAVRGLGVGVEASAARIEVRPDLPAVLADEEELARLFVNLAGNALKYHHLDRAPEVVISAETRGDMVVVSVADNGIGIAPQYFERIFGIFQRLHGRDKYEGTGIGLAICKKIVERHGGRIWVESEADRGATFLFTLKAAPGPRGGS
jgi:PAS domain S-box-containing protein